MSEQKQLSSHRGSDYDSFRIPVPTTDALFVGFEQRGKHMALSTSRRSCAEVLASERSRLFGL